MSVNKELNKLNELILKQRKQIEILEIRNRELRLENDHLGIKDQELEEQVSKLEQMNKRIENE